MTISLTNVECVDSTTKGESGGGVRTNATVRLDGAPDALRGYRVRLNATDGVIIDSVDPVLITGRQFTVQDGGAGTSALTAGGVNLTGSNNFTDNRTLFRATFAGNVTRSDLETQVLDLLDGTGNDMDPNRVSVTLSQETPGASGSPFDRALSGGEAPPADADGDGKTEDIDGNGEFNFVDVITLVFALSSLTDLSQAQTAALDFSGDDAVDFVDVITLVFEL
jgi:PKD repeat protein